MDGSAHSLQAERRALGWGAFGVGYLAAFFLSTALPTPVLWYLPLERRFVFAVRPDGLAADFYGRVALCLFAGGVALGVARIASARISALASARWIRQVMAWSAALLLFTAALYIYLLIGRHAQPAPFPPGYVPR